MALPGPTHNALRGIALAFAVLMLAAMPRAAAAQLGGLWMIERELFDSVPENGLDVGSFPVLAIGEDQTFRLYRVGPPCAPLDEAGADAGPIEAAELCYRRLAANARDALGVGARVLAEGTWEQAPDGRVRFAARSVAPVPQWWRRTIAEQQGRPPGMPFRAWLRLQAAVGTYYTTFFVGDGRWLTAQVSGDSLVLGAGVTRELHYRRTTGQALTATGATITELQLSGMKYFRCLLGLVEGTRTGGPDRAELLRLTALAARANALYARFAHADELEQAGRAAEGEQIFGANDRAALIADTETLRAHPLHGSQTAGVTFGCPERDGLY